MSKSENPNGVGYNDPNVTRRRAMQIMGATAMVYAGAGAVSASGGSLNYESDLSPDPEARGTVALADLDLSGEDIFSFTNDSGEDVSLADWGAYLRKYDSNDDPRNPVLYRANWLDTQEYGDMPRGESYEDGNGDTVEPSVLESSRWSGVSTDMSVTDIEPASGGEALKFAASNMTSGDTVSATFSDGGSDWSFLIEEGIGRRYLQIGLNIPTLPSGSLIEIKVKDSTGSTNIAKVDAGGDSSNADVIEDSTGTGIVYQRELAEWSTSLDDIDALEVAISDANAEIEVFALNAEKESKWTFGTNEFINSDDELDSNTIEEPSGDINIVEPSTIGFAEGSISDAKLDVGLRASGQPDEHIDVDEDADPGRFQFDERVKVAQSIEVPSAYDLSWSNLKLVEEIRHPADRYRSVESAAGLDEEATVSEVVDEDVSTIDRTSTLEDGSDGDFKTLEDPISPGTFNLVYHDLLLTQGEYDEITSGGGIAGGPLSGGGGSFLSTPLGVLTAVSSGLVGYLGIARGWFSNLMG